MSTVPDHKADPFEGLAAERKPIDSGKANGRHLMVQVGDELTGTIVDSELVDGKYGEFGVIKVDPVKAISDGADTTGNGEVELRCTGYSLEEWFKSEAPEAGDLVSIQLASLVDTGKDSPMKSYSIALRRPAEYDPAPSLDERPPLTDDDIPWPSDEDAAA